MSQMLRDQLARGAEAVEPPVLDVADLVAQAKRRLMRRRRAAVAAVAAAVAVIMTGGLALRSDDNSPSPAPPPPPSKTTHPKPAAGPAVYFDALAVEGDDLTDPARSLFGQKDLYLTREGAPARQIIATAANEHCPRVSPDGGMLAYLKGGRTVVVQRLNSTGDPGATTASAEFDRSGLTCPQWSPDGRHLAVATSGYQAPDQFTEVRVIELDGTDRLLATRRDQVMPLSEISWSPDSDAIAFTTPYSVWVAPLGGGEPTMVWQGRASQDPTGLPPPGTPERLAWLPTGELAINALAQYTGVFHDETLHIVDPDSGHDQVLGTFSIAAPTTWSWSPDGSRLVFADSDGGARMFDRASGRSVTLRPRLHGHELPIWNLAWSADGRRLVGTAADADPSTTAFALVSMRPNGSSVEVLTPWTRALYSEADPSWSPR